MIEKFAFYDFDDTLIKHDSMGILVKEFLKQHPLRFYHLFKLGLLFIAYKLKIIEFKPVKEALMFPLKYMTKEDLKKFYLDILSPRYYPDVLKTLEQHAANGYHIWLVSASPEPYLQYSDLPVEVIMGTVFQEENDAYTNKMISLNCKREEKVRRIIEKLKELNLEIDYENSFGYSDSDTDWPMLKLVKNRYRISKKDGSISNFILNSD